MKLLLASHNSGKLAELGSLLEGLPVEVAGLGDYPDLPDPVEDGATFLENARRKVASAASSGAWVLADDSGLCVEALDGGPGVHSARFAGRQGDHAANIAKVLELLRGIPQEGRRATFVCTLVLRAPEGREWVIEGGCDGFIGDAPRGTGGFGYDPIFLVKDTGRTLAEMSLEEKNMISHRARAVQKMLEIIRKHA